MEQLTKEDRPTMRAEYLKRDTADPAMNQWIQKADGTGGYNKHGRPQQWWLTATAEENFQYWISNC